GHADLARDRGVEVQEELDEILKAADRARAMTSQLLATCRQQAVEPRHIDLNEVVTEVQGMLRRLIEENVAIELRLADRLPAVRADVGQIEQIVTNLAINARDAMPRGGRLEFATARVAAAISPLGVDSAMLTVSDSGSGMTAELVETIFEPFFTTKPHGKGTGLGLSTVRSIVEQHGGTVTVETSVGVGTTFSVYLPLSAEAPSPKAEDTAVPAEPGNESVLLVEDEPMIRKVITAMLSRTGYRVTAVGDGEAAWEMLVGNGTDEPRRFDLLITDIVMPRSDGPELVCRISDRLPDMGVLFISGYLDHTPPPGSLMLAKPFSSQDLNAKVREAIDKARAPTV
ncbi:MAG: response regulator, partial [Planctomycetes bacterium]|nr:response regulator [Planctomycetota bacterium]